MLGRKLYVALLVVVSSLALAACGGTTAEPAPTEAGEVDSPEPTEAAKPTAEETVELVVSEFGFNEESVQEIFVKPMEEKYNVEIVYETGNNDDRLSKLESRGAGADIDVIHLTEMFALRAAEMGLIQKLDMSRLEGLDGLYEWARNPDGQGYCVAYAVNSFPLLYRTDKVDPPPTSWKDLLREDLQGKVTMSSIARTFGPHQIVMMSLAHGGDLDDYETGWEHIPQWVDNSLAFVSYELVSLVQEGEVWMAPYGSYMTQALNEIDLPLELAVIPEEGVPGARNVLCVVSGTDQEDMAYAYINHLISKETQKAMGMAVMESPVHKEVELPEDIGSLLTYGEDYMDSLIFPDFSEINPKLDEWHDKWNEIVVE